MEESRARLRNLKILIERHGGIRALEKKTGTSIGYLSHVVGGRRNIGKRMAEKFEATLGLPSGWMDKRH